MKENALLSCFWMVIAQNSIFCCYELIRYRRLLPIIGQSVLVMVTPIRTHCYELIKFLWYL